MDQSVNNDSASPRRREACISQCGLNRSDVTASTLASSLSVIERPLPLKSESRVRTPLLAVVVIGRNEGERLRISLSSVVGKTALTVYVDSGSMDDSLLLARQLNAEVVELDASVPFTAARARNAGFKRAMTLLPQTEFVQFVDGDCELAMGWLHTAKDFLESSPSVAVAFGQQRERNCERSIYNRLCDMEWAVAPGQVKACGGCAMMRADAFVQVGGFREDLIAGEEPEMCVRLRARGWQIHSLPQPMATHDAAMTHFSQWWRRTVRSGYAFAQGAYLHGAPPERHWVWESRRAWIWGLGLPALSLGLAAQFGPWGLAVFGAYPLQMLRQFQRHSGTVAERALKAVFQTVGRFPEMIGQFQFWRDRLLRMRSRLIEYK